MSNLRRSDWASHAQNYYNQASGSYRGMDRGGPEEPEKNAGGALGAAAGGAVAGSTFGPWGAAAGAGIGILGYMLG